MKDGTTVIVAGATGQLGARITTHLLGLGASVRALVRPGTDPERLRPLQGAELAAVDFGDPAALAAACRGAACVVSAVAGLRDTIVDLQTALLQAAVEAGVPRFIPSDFSIDFTRLPRGSNRNLDLRTAFRERLERAPVQATSILNGAFTDMLTGQAPFILFGMRRVLCWGDPDQQMDWTTLTNTAEYTAHAALDPATPRFLRIAAEQISAHDLAQAASDVTGQRFTVLRPGGLGLLRALIRITRVVAPGGDALYPAWQGMQYMHDMYSGLAKFARVDNDRYPIRWIGVRDVLSSRRTHAQGRPARPVRTAATRLP